MTDLSLKEFETSSQISDYPGFQTHDGVRALAVRLMMITRAKVKDGYVRVTQAEINAAGEISSDWKRSFAFDGEGEGKEIYVKPVYDEYGDLLWTDAIIAVEKALSLGLLPSQIWAYYLKGNLVVTPSYKVMIAWAEMVRPFNVYHFPMTQEERLQFCNKYGDDDFKDIKVMAYLIDKDQVVEMGQLTVQFLDRGMSVDEARKQACEVLQFGKGDGVLRGFEKGMMADNAFTPERKAMKRATIRAITGSLGEPTFFGIQKLYGNTNAVAAIAAGQVVNVPEHIPVSAEKRYIEAEVDSPNYEPVVNGVELMRGPVEEGID